MRKRIQNLTLVSWKTTPEIPREVGEVVDNDADKIERTGPRHGQPEINKENSGNPEEGREASAAGEGSTTTTDWSPIAR